MRILVASDFHGNLGSAKALGSCNVEFGGSDVDAAVLCGDLSEFGSFDKGVAIIEEVRKGFQDVFYVTGNHDPPLLMKYGDAIGNGKSSTSRVTCLHGRFLKFGDFTFIGMSGFHPAFYGSWNIEGQPIDRDNEAEQFLDSLITKAIDGLHAEPKRIVLVTHDPPFGACDFSVLSRSNAGSQGIRRTVLKWKPAAICCGHIHEARGIARLGETLVVNPGSIHFKLAAYLDLEKVGAPVAELAKI
ncbi:MAG: metallophosphoesterase family protein [Candidatus Atabeyarchaeum deiterrae]